MGLDVQKNKVNRFGLSADTRAIDSRLIRANKLGGKSRSSHTNWKLNMKRRELIKPDLNPPYTRLCKEDIKPSAKLFGDDLPKHLKDMAEAKKVGQQMQKPATSRPLTQNHYSAKSYKQKVVRSKPYDRTSNTFSRRPFLGPGRASNQGNLLKRNNNVPNRKGQ